jgi:hypothetical protein
MSEQYINSYETFKTVEEAEEYIEKQEVWFYKTRPKDYQEFLILTKIRQTEDGWVATFTAEKT